MSTTSPSNTETPAKAKRRCAPAPARTSKQLTAICPEGLYRVNQFSASILPFGKTRWHQGVKSGEFPPPVVRRKRMTLWRGSDILYVAAHFGQP